MQETRYRVQSLERGLSILRELQIANAPMRNRELVSRTGLPKATISRLLSTLEELDYVRRTDQGSYVLARQSARTGRAMLGALGLQQYSELFVDALGPVYLEALTEGRLVPVYRWWEGRGNTLVNTPTAGLGPSERLEAWQGGTHWDAEEQAWWLWEGFHSEPVGSFVLTVKVNSTCPPAQEAQAATRDMLGRAVGAMTLGK